jgi:hypothetical protein
LTAGSFRVAAAAEIQNLERDELRAAFDGADSTSRQAGRGVAECVAPDQMPQIDPSLSASFLRNPQAKVAGSTVVIGHYDIARGLFAGVEARSGKRFLIKAWWQENGAVIAEVAHLNANTGRVELLFGKSRRVDSRTGRWARSYDLVGADLVAAIAQRASRIKQDDPADPIARFLRSHEGQAFAEAVPALYVALEHLESNPRLADLQKPLGGILTLMQLVTGVYGSYNEMGDLFGRDRADAMRAACGHGAECRYRGRHFTVQSSGLFDTFSKAKTKSIAKVAPQCGFSAMSQVRPAASNISAIGSVQKDAAGDVCRTDPCFGVCGGPGCYFTPGNFTTPECTAHDMCVCRFGHLDCLLEVPAEGCGDEECGNLIDAAISWIEEWLRELFGPHPEVEATQEEQQQAIDESQWWDDEEIGWS